MVEGEDAKCFWLVHVLNSVGFGLFCAWPYCFLVPMAFGPSAGTSNGADYRFFTVGATLLVYLAILALRRTALKDRIQSPVVQGVGALLAAVGALLMALDGDVISPRGSAGAAFAGAGSAVLSIGWCARLSGRDEIDVDFVVAGGFFLAMVVAMGALYFPQGGLLLFRVALPLASFAFLAAGVQGETLRPEIDGKSALRTKKINTLKYTSLALVFFWMLHVILERDGLFMAANSRTSFALALGCGSVMAAGVVALYLWFSKGPSLKTILFVSIPLLVVGVMAKVLLPITPGVTVPYCLSFAAMISANVFIWIEGIKLARAGILSPPVAISILRSFSCVGIVLSLVLSSSTFIRLEGDDLYCFLLSVLLLATLLAFLGFEREARAEIAPRIEEKAEVGQPESVDQPLEPQGDYWYKEPAFSEEFGLTERERQVLVLLVKGRNAPFIQEALFISRNTVNSHIKHIYAKVGVHSKQELIDVLERDWRLPTGELDSPR